MRVYLDTAPVVFLVEQIQGAGDRVKDRLRRGAAAGDVFVVSDVTRFECRVAPLRNADTDALAAFESFFAAREIVLEAVPRSAWEIAADVRAHHGLRTPDAIHVGCALALGCDMLLTADTRLSKCEAIQSELIPVDA